MAKKRVIGKRHQKWKGACQYSVGSEVWLAVRNLSSPLTLIIRGELTEPPTWFPSYRELTMKLKGTVVAVILIESERKLRDLYWKWTGRNGGRDYVNDLIFSDEYEPGIKLDARPDQLHPTITAERIVPENLAQITHRVSVLAGQSH